MKRFNVGDQIIIQSTETTIIEVEKLVDKDVVDYRYYIDQQTQFGDSFLESDYDKITKMQTVR